MPKPLASWNKRFAPLRLEVGVGPVPAKEPAHRPEGRRRDHEDQAQSQNGPRNLN